ncbi:MAG: YbhB/YbcL family Raf kinase inhibitor-like protein [Actinomycetota bacterium]
MKAKAPIIAVLAFVVTACSSGAMSTTEPSTTAADSATTAPSMTEGASMELTSPAFGHEEPIPSRYGCDGENISPELTIAGVPPAASSLVLIMDDPDAPAGTWDHWVAYDIEPTGTVPEDVGVFGTAGLNSWKQTGYGGPCPPSGTHRYFFRILALDAELGLAEGATKAEVLAAAEGHVLAEAVLMGTYDAK